MIGKVNIGKSLLTSKYVNDVPYDSSIEDLYRTFIIIENKCYDVQILDIGCGLEDYPNFLDMWVRFAEGILLVFSIDNKESFELIKNKREKIITIKNENFIPMILVGNKQDLSDIRQVSYEEAKQLCDSWGIEYIETSAINNYNCKEAFEKLILKIASNKIKQKKPSICNCLIS